MKEDRRGSLIAKLYSSFPLIPVMRSAKLGIARNLAESDVASELSALWSIFLFSDR